MLGQMTEMMPTAMASRPRQSSEDERDMVGSLSCFGGEWTMRMRSMTTPGSEALAGAYCAGDRAS